jgi:hypothetical protein
MECQSSSFQSREKATHVGGEFFFCEFPLASLPHIVFVHCPFGYWARSGVMVERLRQRATKVLYKSSGAGLFTCARLACILETPQIVVHVCEVGKGRRERGSVYEFGDVDFSHGKSRTAIRKDEPRFEVEGEHVKLLVGLCCLSEKLIEASVCCLARSETRASQRSLSSLGAGSRPFHGIFILPF